MEKADGRMTRAQRAGNGLCSQEETARRILRRAQTQQDTENNKGSSEATLTKPQHQPQEGETATNSSHPKTGLNTAYRNVTTHPPEKVKFKMATHKLPDTQKGRKTRPRTRRP